MRVFYVSLAKDLFHCYLAFRAESEKAVRQYLESEYLKTGVWTLPWCSVYEKLPPGESKQIVIPAMTQDLVEVGYCNQLQEGV